MNNVLIEQQQKQQQQQQRQTIGLQHLKRRDSANMLEVQGGGNSSVSAASSTTMDYDVPVPRRILIKSKLYAKAIYDNYPDTPDELAFKKGDMLTVLEQDTEGIEGWWLCTLREQKGLCPGNRLRIVNSYDSGCFSPSPSSSPIPSLAASTATLNSSICSAELYENSSMISAGSGTGSASGSGSILGTAADLSSSSQWNQTAMVMRPTRSSWHVSHNKVITPQRQGDAYFYCLPSSASSTARSPQQSQPQQQQQQQQQQIYSNQSLYENFSMMATSASNGNSNGNGNGNGNASANASGNEFETYDIPKPATPVNYNSPKGLAGRIHHPVRLECTIEEESYDVPRPLNSSLQHTLTPSSSASSLLTSDSHSLSCSFSSSNRSSVNMPDYDVPRRIPMPVRLTRLPLLTLQQQHQLQQQQQQQRRTTTAGANGQSPMASTPKELPLELSLALETLAKLQSETTAAITRLLSFVVPNWRSRAQLDPVIMELKLAALRLRTALHDLAEFGEGALGNATRSEDRNLAMKLRPLVRALRDANKLIHDSSEELDAQGGWSVEQLARNEEKQGCRPPDSLDQLMACAQTLTEDVRSTSSFIHGNASLLFKRQLPPNSQDAVDNANAPTGGATTTEGNRASAEWLEDYDYVSFESKDAAARKNQALREVIPAGMKTQFDSAIQAAENAAMGTAAMLPPATPTAASTHSVLNKQPELPENEKMVVFFYAQQISQHMDLLHKAIDSFLETVQKNRPPKYFIAYGKFVVVTAHHLIPIGDIVHRNISWEKLREKIRQCTNGLSDALKTCVQKSKMAAAHFPSGSAVQEMVDSVVYISQVARDLKTAMLQACK